MGEIGTTVTTKCCYCGKVKRNGRWHDSIDLGETLHSHGCCPVCEARLMSELDSLAAPGAMSAGADVLAFRPHHVRRPIRAIIADAAV